jgi:hypothetical protein
MTAKYDTWLSVLVGESFGMQAWEVFQSTIFDEVGVRKWFFWEINFALLA